MKSSNKNIKLSLLAIVVFSLTVWFTLGAVLERANGAGNLVGESPALDDDYVGTETCAACHEAQFKSFEGTKHGKLHTVSSWKGKVVGCETCHGPGKAHVEGGGDKTKIRSFKGLNAKAISETCLGCHAGKENHNNFRRGEHWRNNIGCTDCHTAHGPDPGNFKSGSATFVGDVAAQKPGQATRAMLRSNEPQLCMSCHTETKAQFTKP
ncbi:MAG: multiheme c-type cytochrome, partial [Acidobacteriota bacterium]